MLSPDRGTRRRSFEVEALRLLADLAHRLDVIEASVTPAERGDDAPDT
jgi:hypothetical protein